MTDINEMTMEQIEAIPNSEIEKMSYDECRTHLDRLDALTNGNTEATAFVFEAWDYVYNNILDDEARKEADKRPPIDNLLWISKPDIMCRIEVAMLGDKLINALEGVSND